MAANSSLPAGVILPQFCGDVPLVERQGLCIPQIFGFFQKPNVPPGQLPVGSGGLVCRSGSVTKVPKSEHGETRCARAREKLWWDTPQERKTAGSPDCSHEKSKEVSRIHDLAWVEPQLAGWDTDLEIRMIARPASTPNFLLPCNIRPSRSVKFKGESTVAACSTLSEKGHLNEAIGSLDFLVQSGSRVPISLFYSVLKGCLAKKNLILGRRVHALAIKGGYQSNTFLANHFLRMYASHGRLQEAIQVFAQVTVPNTFIWFSMMSAYAEHGKPAKAIELYRRMRNSTLKPNSYVFVAALKACAASGDLELGRQMHAEILESGIHDIVVGNCVVDMYTKCGSLEDARRVFDTLPTRNVVTWNSMINGYAEHGHGHGALALFSRMELEDNIVANSVTFACILKACASVGALQEGKQLHSQVVERGLEADLVVGTCLVDMYVKCGSLEDARKLFDNLPAKDVVTWSSMINGYAEHGHGDEALALYTTMELEGIVVNNFVFACLLKACTCVGALQRGKQLHAQIVERGLSGDRVLGNCLVDMYAKCGSLQDARKVFDDLQGRDVVTWNTMLNGYVDHALGHEALALYARMEQEDMTLADYATLACVLKACAAIGDLPHGKQVHANILKRGFKIDIDINTCLVDMYAKCGSLEDARSVFDDMPRRNVVTWNSLIDGYVKNGLGQAALDLYSEMELEGMISANEVTFSCLMKACASIAALQKGKQLHSQIVERGLQAEIVVGNCLVDMYAKCGSLEDAQMVFDGLPSRDVVTWNTMINGYTEHELGQEAVALYARMQQEGITVANDVTYTSVLRACTSVGAFQQGKQLHADILERGWEADAVVGSSLVDMYAKCGSLEDTRKVFDSLPEKDVMVWNAMIHGCGQSSEGQKAIDYFHEMLQAGVEANESTFTCLLVACSQAGLVNKGRHYFHDMQANHGILPTRQHYVCMTDLLGRSGHLDEAESMLLSMPGQGDVVGWTSLLSACRTHRDMHRGRQCFESLVRLDPQNASAYVLMANIYADAGRWTDVDRIEKLRKSVGASKKAARAGIEVNRQVHTFVVGEERDGISSKLRNMTLRWEEGGHVPHTELVLKPVSEKVKEHELCGHAEKLALAYGLLNTPDGAPLLVTKNLRMCGDCHSATRVMSRIERREITVRDTHRVHRFVDGSCSCGDRP